MSLTEQTLLYKGIKNDQGKPDWFLLPFEPVEEIVQVLTHGAKKYSPDNWKSVVEPSPERYFSAAMRHLAAWRKGEKRDPDSGFSHLAHAACCVLFLMWREGSKT